MNPSRSGQPETPSSRDESLHVDRSGIVRNPAREEVAKSFAIELARQLLDDKCSNVVVLDLRGISQATDFFIVASGTSQRQMRSAGVHIEEYAREQQIKSISHNLNDRDSNWFVLDFVDVVVHIFEPETRAYYDLEMLWGDAEPVAWERPERSRESGNITRGETRNRAGLRPGDVIPSDQSPSN